MLFHKTIDFRDHFPKIGDNLLQKASIIRSTSWNILPKVRVYTLYYLKEPVSGN